MSRPKMLPGTRPLKEMLSTRIASHVYDRMRAFAISSRYTIEEITTAAIEAYLDAQAPDTRAKFPPPKEPRAVATGPSTDTARIDALESKLDRLLDVLGKQQPAPAAAGGRRHR